MNTRSQISTSQLSTSQPLLASVHTGLFRVIWEYVGMGCRICRYVLGEPTAIPLSTEEFLIDGPYKYCIWS